MAAAPLLVMVCGPNGSGKSTLTNALRAAAGVQLPATYINADDIQKERQIDSAQAQQVAAKLRAQAIAAMRDVMYETVMSHPSKLGELQQAKAAGFRISVHAVATDDPAINVQRVALRVAAGGHDVPEERTRRRYARTMALLPAAIGQADEALVFDNSARGDAGGLRLQALIADDRLVLATDQPAAWVAQLVARVQERRVEVEQIRQVAQARALSLEVADLHRGRSQGPIEFAGRHFVLQQDLARHVHVLHDRLLLPSTMPLLRGANVLVAYNEGVSAIDVQGPVRRPQT
ncbi:MAG TPA: zeta toxin family protein [Burkholderiaceae bacterium]|nr:zeta toxin family protein [Burkholderiaceae bacterium]